MRCVKTSRSRVGCTSTADASLLPTAWTRRNACPESRTCRHSKPYPGRSALPLEFLLQQFLPLLEGLHTDDRPLVVDDEHRRAAHTRARSEDDVSQDQAGDAVLAHAFLVRLGGDTCLARVAGEYGGRSVRDRPFVVACEDPVVHLPESVGEGARAQGCLRGRPCIRMVRHGQMHEHPLHLTCANECVIDLRIDGACEFCAERTLEIRDLVYEHGRGRRALHAAARRALEEGIILRSDWLCNHEQTEQQCRTGEYGCVHQQDSLYASLQPQACGPASVHPPGGERALVRAPGSIPPRSAGATHQRAPLP